MSGNNDDGSAAPAATATWAATAAPTVPLKRVAWSDPNAGPATLRAAFKGKMNQCNIGAMSVGRGGATTVLNWMVAAISGRYEVGFMTGMMHREDAASHLDLLSTFSNDDELQGVSIGLVDVKGPSSAEELTAVFTGRLEDGETYSASTHAPRTFNSDRALGAIVLVVPAEDITNADDEGRKALYEQVVRVCRGFEVGAGDKKLTASLRVVPFVVGLDKIPSFSAMSAEEALTYNSPELKEFVTGMTKLGFAPADVIVSGWLHEAPPQYANRMEPRVNAVWTALTRAVKAARLTQPEWAKRGLLEGATSTKADRAA